MTDINVEEINVLLEWYVANLLTDGTKASQVTLNELTKEEKISYTAILWAIEKIEATQLPENDWLVVKVLDNSPVTTS